MIKVDLIFFMLTPWYVVRSIKTADITFSSKTLASYLFVILCIGQWGLILLSSKNYIFGYLSANLFLIGFLSGNLYLQLEMPNYSLNDQRFLLSPYVRLLMGIGATAQSHILGSLPLIVGSSLAESAHIGNVTNALPYQIAYQSELLLILFCCWLIFILICRGDVFLLFPRSSEVLWPAELKTKTRLWLCFYYLVEIALFFSFWLDGRLLLNKIR